VRPRSLRICAVLVCGASVAFAFASQLTPPTGALSRAAAGALSSRGAPTAAAIEREFGNASGAAPQWCADEGRSAGGVQPIRCAVPPGGSLPKPSAGSPLPPVSSSGTPPATGSGAPATPPAPPQQSADPGFRYHPPGMLAVRDEKRGRTGDRKVYMPDIIFPIALEIGRFASMNSQIWGYGGGGYNNVGEAGGTECDPRNYDPMSQRDNFCEVRGWSMPLCPAGQGHQGQDIRPPSCKDNTWNVVAVADGVITFISSNTTVRLKATDGTVFEYLHMHPDSIKVKEGEAVKQGQVLGRVSNFMNGSRSTTHHLHFNARQRLQVGNKVLDVYVPVYSSLISAYRKNKGLSPGIGPDSNLIVDPELEIGAVAQAPQTPAPTPASPPQPPAPTPPAPPAPTPAPPAPPAPTPAPPPAPPPPTPAPTPPPPAPTPAPPVPAPPPPAPTPAPPAPAPAPPPAPTPAPTPAQPPAPTPAPSPPPAKSWWQRGVDKLGEYWRGWWK